MTASLNRKSAGISKEEEIEAYRKEKVFNYLMEHAERVVLENRRDKRKQQVIEVKEMVHPSIPYDRKAKQID